MVSTLYPSYQAPLLLVAGLYVQLTDLLRSVLLVPETAAESASISATEPRQQDSFQTREFPKPRYKYVQYSRTSQLPKCTTQRSSTSGPMRTEKVAIDILYMTIIFFFIFEFIKQEKKVYRCQNILISHNPELSILQLYNV